MKLIPYLKFKEDIVLPDYEPEEIESAVEDEESACSHKKTVITIFIIVIHITI
jgi:hypothetical protein